MKVDPQARLPPRAADSVALAVPTRPGRNGGRLQSGNPKSRGRTPFWIRQQLQAGLVTALPAIRHALKHRKDLHTGAPLSYADWLKTAEVAARISMPAEKREFSGDAPFTIQLVAPGPVDEPGPGPAPHALPKPIGR